MVGVLVNMRAKSGRIACLLDAWNVQCANHHIEFSWLLLSRHEEAIDSKDRGGERKEG